ncbi:MAG: EAL domain-containing protein [Gallionellaceae bacterium]|nr:MAG: EAL domain-containing protein [Gallionellaceae bacterium]
MKIAPRLLFLFVLVAVLPLASFSYLNLQQDEATLRGEALGWLANMADKKAAQIGGYMSERIGDVRLLARMERTQQALLALSQAYRRYGPGSAEYARTDAAFHGFFAAYMEEGHVHNVFLITPQGEIVYTRKHGADFATSLITGPYRESQLAKAFRAARMTLEPILSTYELYAPSDNAPAAFIVAPVMVQGRFEGMFAVQLDNERLIRVATDATGLGMSGETEVAEPDGAGGARFTAPLKSDPQATMQRRVKRAAPGAPILLALGGEPGEGVKQDYRGKPVVAAWHYLPALGWGMVVKMDADEIFGPIYRQRTVMLQVLAGLLLFSSLIALYFERRISAPLERLAQTANAMSGGDMGRRVDESAPGELGQFARAFNRMAENLQTLYRTLEDRIEERTRDLHASNEQLQEEIIEREQTEAALRDSEEHLRSALDDLRYQKFALDQHAIVAITDVRGTITYVNEKFCEISGYSQAEMLGKNHRILNSGTHPAKFFHDMYRTIAAGKVWHGEICNRAKGGQLYWVMTTIVPYRDNAGKPTQYIAIRTDITARKRAEEEIRNLAFFDALTGLPNRRLLLDRLQSALLLSARSRHCGALLFLDMDRFKTLNDTLGHDCGDLMLIGVGGRIQACVREADTVARLGGDEFVVLIEEIGADMEEASQKVALIAEKIRAALAAPYSLRGHEYHSSPSIGVSMYRGNTETVDVLMKRADMAMYQAKDAGRNTVRFFDPLMQRAVEVRAELEADLRGALPNGQLQLYYQIQVDGDHRPVGAEALIRWMHPRRGMVAPAQFIPEAEESGQILDIGLWVIETACRQLAAWAQDERMRRLTLAVNVSAQQFHLRDFVELTQEVIVRHGISPERLKLELTESVVLEDVADVAGKMHALKALGVRLSLDDFGTGYSSLVYLKQLPLDQIKIDQSFVRDVTSDQNDAVMVQAIIGMAQNFRLNVIAEGVETGAQLAFLKQNGCMAYQGYLFGKPAPLAEFEALARRLFG